MSVPQSSPHLFEEDIVLDETVNEIIKNIDGFGFRTKRDTIANHIKLWPNGVVYYTIEPNIGMAISKRIRRAFRHISKRSCITFVPRLKKEKNYIHFINGYGCYSSVGKIGGVQTVSLDRHGCMFSATHEVMHALGFFHEQSRTDRDRYVKILWWNIQNGMERNFQSYPNGITDTLDQPYDVKSIMHYGNKAFSKNGRETIVSLIQPGMKLGGQHKKLTKIDTYQLNKLYNCNQRDRRHLRRYGQCSNLIRGCYRYSVGNMNACDYNYEFMKHYCTRSCGFC